MMVRVLYRHDVPKKAKCFCKEIMNSMTSDDTVFAVHLGGAHSKGLVNSQSDYDIKLYYLRPLTELLSLNPSGLSFTKEFGKDLYSDNGTTYIERYGENFEVLFLPMWSYSASKTVLPSLFKQNGDYVYKLFMGLDLYQNDYFTVFMSNLSEQYLWSAEALKGFFLGYMTSQALSHKRARDYARAEKKAVEEGTITPVVKQIIEAVSIGLNGYSFLTSETFYGDFLKLFQFYDDRFPEDVREFIEKLYHHKIEIERLPSTAQCIQLCNIYREKIFGILSDMLKNVDPVIPVQLTKSENRKNAELLSKHLRFWYGIP